MLWILECCWFFASWVTPISLIGMILYVYESASYDHFTKLKVPFIEATPVLKSVLSRVFKKQYFPQVIIKYYNQLQDHAYGGFFILRQPTVMVRDPEIIKAVTVTDFEYFTDHRPLLHEHFESLWAKGLICLKGQRWKDMRSILNPAFTSDKMKNMFGLMSDCCQQFVEFLQHCYQHPPTENYNIQKDGKILKLELKDFFDRYTIDVIATTVFGLRVNSMKQQKNEFYMKGQDATDSKGFRFFTWLGYLTVPRLMQIISSESHQFFLVSGLKDDRNPRTNKYREARYATIFIWAKEGVLDEENCAPTRRSKFKLDDEDIIAQVLMFFLAGFDTTSTLLCFASHQLATHPAIQTRLQKEIDKTLKKSGGKITYEALHNMKYLDMIVSETLRLFPPTVAVDRVCVRPYTLQAYPTLAMRPGDSLHIPIIAIHRDPQYFPEPERFNPERFSDENRHKINPMTYLPFGIGPRNCIGRHFALMEAKLAMVQLLTGFNLRIIPKTPLPIRIVQEGLSMTVEGGFWLGLEQRSSL